MMKYVDILTIDHTVLSQAIALGALVLIGILSVGRSGGCGRPWPAV